MTLTEEISELSRAIVERCAQSGAKAATAESCTGGMISAAITAVAGSSAAIELGVCSYSNRIKREVLGVSGDTLSRKSEYSAECAQEMARGVMELAGADFGVSTTGVAGPAGGSAQHPVGEVHIGVCSRTQCRAERFLFSAQGAEPRAEIRAQATRQALAMLLELMQG